MAAHRACDDRGCGSRDRRAKGHLSDAKRTRDPPVAAAIASMASLVDTSPADIRRSTKRQCGKMRGLGSPSPQLQAPRARAKDGYRSDAACVWPPRPRTRLFGGQCPRQPGDLGLPVWASRVTHLGLDLLTGQEDLKHPFPNTAEGKLSPFLITSWRPPRRNFRQQHE
jgi:hypothetical protein